VGKPEGKNYLKGLALDGRIKIKFSFKKQDGVGRFGLD
jgi:hypothetical protein